MSQLVNLSWRQTAELARPTNYTRNVYHAANGVAVSWLILHLVDPTGMVVVALGFAVAAWLAESSRRIWPGVNAVMMTVWGKTAHPHELKNVNSGTWIVTSMLVIALLYTPVVCAVGVVVCGFGDPAAAVVGRKFGRIHIKGGRTLAGTTAFVVVGAASALLILTLYAPEIAWSKALIVATIAGLTGALAELFAPVDDNLSIPVVASTTAWLTMAAMGLSPELGFVFQL